MTDNLVERLRSPLPVCPFDRRSPDYWTAGEDGKPCHVCGTTESGPDLCRGADTRCMAEAATKIETDAAEITRLQEALAAAEAEIERLLPIEAEAAEGREINGELRTKLVEAEARLTALRWAGAGLANIAHNIHQLGAADPSALQSLKSSQIEWDAAIRSLSNDEAPK